MKDIAIYVEGGGNRMDSKDAKAALRIGFDQLLNSQKQAARNKKLGWRLVPCGNRDRAYKAFANAIKTSGLETVTVLLVDSEESIPPEVEIRKEESPAERHIRLQTNARTRCNFLARRDSWDFSDINPEQVHLMVQCMETWIVADRKALQEFYGQGFRANLMPVRNDLEDEPKQNIYKQLELASKDSRKGAYSKITHASKLLSLIDSQKIGARCSRFSTFVGWLSDQIDIA